MSLLSRSTQSGGISNRVTYVLLHVLAAGTAVAGCAVVHIRRTKQQAQETGMPLGAQDFGIEPLASDPMQAMSQVLAAAKLGAKALMTRREGSTSTGPSGNQN